MRGPERRIGGRFCRGDGGGVSGVGRGGYGEAFAWRARWWTEAER